MKRRLFVLVGVITISIAGGGYVLTHRAPKRLPIEVTQLKENVYLMNDNNESTGYIVIGTEKAAVIDTMYGYENIYDVVRTVTDLPLVVLNTHGHIDHVSGNCFFDEVYIDQKDAVLAQNTFESRTYNNMKEKYNVQDAKIKWMQEGDAFDLGGITLEIYEVPGHTPGSVCILDKEDRILFTGDSINRHCWMQLEESTSLETFYESLDRLVFLNGSYDTILSGHTQGCDTASLYEEHKAAVKEVIDGVSRQQDEDYTYFGGTCKVHKSTQGNVSIVYNE